MRGRESIEASLQRGLRSIRAKSLPPADRLSWPPQLDFQYGGYSDPEADELAASLDLYAEAPPAVQYLAYWATIRSLTSAGYVDHADALLPHLETLVTDLRSQWGLDNLAYLRGRVALQRSNFAGAAQWFSAIAPPVETDRISWFQLTVAWHLLRARALSDAPFDVTSSDLVDPWTWFRREPHLVVLRQSGALSSALALHRLGRHDLADRFAAWMIRDAESSPMEPLAHELAVLGLPTAPVDRHDHLDTLVDELIAAAPDLAGRRDDGSRHA